MGSPPHTRGKLIDVLMTLLEPRITPAYAGKISRGAGFAPSPADHPRIRGENASTAVFGVEDDGSPPHTRGK